MLKTIPVLLLILLCCAQLPAAADIGSSYAAEAEGEYDAALSVMQELQVKEPNDPFYQLRVAWLQYLKANYGEAAVSYQKAIALNDNLDAHMGLINSYVAMGKYAEALAEARLQADAHPKNPMLLGQGAYAAYMIKDYRSAAEFYGRIVAVYPWDMQNRAYYMNNLFLSEQDAAAREQYFFLKKYYPQSSLLPTYKRIFEP